jgi:hypothetical protein
MGPVGRTYTSAASFITLELFFTDDNGIYFFSTRNLYPEIEIQSKSIPRVNAFSFVNIRYRHQQQFLLLTFQILCT